MTSPGGSSSSRVNSLARPAIARREFWLLQTGGWIAFGVAMALSRVGRYPLDYMVATKVALAALGFGVTLVIRALYRRILPPETPLVRSVVTTVAVSYGFSLLWSAAYNLIDAAMQRAIFGRGPVIDTVTELFSESVYHAFALLAWSVFYIAIKRHQSLQEERERVVHAESLAREARLQALRFQIQPHLLFNTLNAISTLVAEQRNAEASRMLARLADFFRQTLATPDRNEVPLRDELKFVESYLAIEQIRFGDRLALTWDVDDAVLGAQVPTHLLQPLVENAVRHAVEPRQAGGTIRIMCRRTPDGRSIELVVRDSGAAGNGRTSGRAGAGGIGLTNTRDRLARLYGDAHRLEIRDGTHGFEVVIALPFRESPT